MKTRFFLFAALLLTSFAIKAQMFTAINLMTPHYYPGEIYFTDGHHEEFAEIELPQSGKSKLGVKKNVDDKKYTDIKAIDIIGIRIWHKDFPDKPHTLYYIHAKKTMMQSEHQWGNPVVGSAWGVVFQCDIHYQLDTKTGEMEVVKFVGGTSPNTPTIYYLVRKEWELAELVLWNGSFDYIKNKVAGLFAENKDIATAIKKGDLKGSDMQYILDEMAGGKKAAEPIMMIPEVKTDSVTNGVVGDDE